MSLPNEFINFLKANKIAENLNLQYQIFSKSDMINWLKESNDIQSVLFRYNKPILLKLLSKGLMPIELFNKYSKQLYSEIGIRYYSGYSNTENNNYIENHQGYFRIRLTPNNYEQLKEHIIKTYETTTSKYKNVVFVKLSQFEKFLDEYNSSKNVEINIDKGNKSCHISCSTAIDWNNELITNFKDFWKWDDLQRNESITWNFDLIDANIDKLNWAYLYSYTSLTWSIEYIFKYIDYIVFSSKIRKNKLGYSYYKWFPSDDNKYRYSQYCGSISLSHSVQWSKELIDCFIEYWDWEELCRNEAIEWSIELITLYNDKVNFDSLSKNKGLKWSIPLIECFFTRWNWNFLSSNPSLPWSDELIEKYDSYWVWRDDKINYQNIINQNDSINCISANTSVNWSVELLTRYSEVLDFWLISLFGNFDFEALKKFPEKFDEKRIIDTEVHRYSDYGTESAAVYRTGWENLALNNNVYISPRTISFLYLTFIQITVIEGNFANDGFHRQLNKNLLEVLHNNEIKDFDLIDVINNELSWGGVLINDNFISQPLFDKYIKGMINDTFLSDYLAKLFDQ
ncbi:MAG: hypothetical protein PHP53_05150 [Prolixibacteraceae bacterium]|nr:hypothetical protein [Prolixibacteraceae bacterium]